MRHSFLRRSLIWARSVASLIATVSFVSDAGAVVTTACCYSGTRTLTLRVGTPTAGAIDTVQFNVDGASAGNSLPTVASSNGNGTPITATSGGVVIYMNMQVPVGNLAQSVTTTVTSPAGLTCISGGCSSTSIPFSKISWTATPQSSDDFQNGAFIAGSTQTIQSGALPGGGLTGILISIFGGTYTASSTLNFTYANDTAYPAGSYSGTVTYTATLP